MAIDFTLLSKDVATAAHHGLTRNDKTTPYITHPIQVAVIAAQITIAANKGIDLDFVIQVAHLHDVVEDTPVTLEDLKGYGFDPIVIDAVAAITKNPVKGAESYLNYLIRVKNNIYARIVKMADLAHNMSDLRPGNMLDKYILATDYLAWNNERGLIIDHVGH